jgi:hypothetical protein
VWALKVKFWSDRNDLGGVDSHVCHIVVTLDVIEIHKLRDPRLLVEVPQVTVQVLVVHDPFEIALKMPVIHGVKSNQRVEQTPICLYDAVPKCGAF